MLIIAKYTRRIRRKWRYFSTNLNFRVRVWLKPYFGWNPTSSALGWFALTHWQNDGSLQRGSKFVSKRRTHAGRREHAPWLLPQHLVSSTALLHRCARPASTLRLFEDGSVALRSAFSPLSRYWAPRASLFYRWSWGWGTPFDVLPASDSVFDLKDLKPAANEKVVPSSSAINEKTVLFLIVEN